LNDQRFIPSNPSIGDFSIFGDQLSHLSISIPFMAQAPWVFDHRQLAAHPSFPLAWLQSVISRTHCALVRFNGPKVVQ